jgi:hypothetical protein
VPDLIGVRVIFPAEDFPDNWHRNLATFYRVGVGPLAVPLVLCLLFSLVDRSWRGLKYLVGCIPFPLMGLIFAWLDFSA